MRFHGVAIVLVWLTGAFIGSPAAEVAVLCALDADLSKLRAAAEGPVQSLRAGPLTISRFRLGWHVVSVARMYPGTHDSAAVAAAVLARSNARMLLTLGPVGSLDDTLPPGRWIEIVPADETTTTRRSSDAIPATGTWSNLPVVRSASVDRFVASSAERDRLRTERQVRAVEMNLAGLAAAARRFDVPHRHFRIVSDRADEQAPEAFRSFVTAYDGAGGSLLAQCLRDLPPDPGDVEAWPNLRNLLATNRAPAEARAAPGRDASDRSVRTP